MICYKQDISDNRENAFKIKWKMFSFSHPHIQRHMLGALFVPLKPLYTWNTVLSQQKAILLSCISCEGRILLRKQTQNGVAYVKPQVAKPKLNLVTVLALPKNGILARQSGITSSKIVR